MAVSTKVSRSGLWILLGGLGGAATQSAACSAAFHTCYETRTCRSEHEEAGAAGAMEAELGGAKGGAGRSPTGASGSGRGGGGEKPTESGAGGTEEVDLGGLGGAAGGATNGDVGEGGMSGAQTADGGTGSGGKGGGGTAGTADTTAPTIVSISPTNLATGVKSNAQIKITFSEVMNSSATTKALQVGGFEASGLTTSWDAAGKELTVTPKTPFTYATDSSPVGTPATKYTITVGQGATDLAGNALGATFNSSFTTLRRISQSIASGAAAANSTYEYATGQPPQSCPGTDPVWVEIWSGAASGGTFYIFVPFDTTVMGNSLTLESATFSATQVAPEGAFYSAHQVILKSVSYGAIDKNVTSAAVIDSFGVFASSAVAQPTADVFTRLYADLAAGTHHELFRLEPTGAADGAAAKFTCSGFFLNVVYLTP